MSKPTPEKLKPFIFHGVPLDWNTKEAHGDCAICGKEGHFFIKTATGQFDCKRCGEKGNIFGFLQALWDVSFKSTTDKDLGPISKERGIPISELRAWGLAKSILTGEWLLPAYNIKSKLANLYRIVQEDGKWKAYSTPTCKLHPFGIHALNKNHKTLWVAEGPWDGMAWRHALSQIKEKAGGGYIKTTNVKDSLAATEGVLAVPGAGTFSLDWLAYFQDRDTFLCFDNDHPRKTPAGNIIKPGWDGMKRIAKLVRESGTQPETLHRLTWGPKGYDQDRPDGYDLRDLLKDQGPVNALVEAHSLLKPVKLVSAAIAESGEEVEESLEPLPRSTFAELLKDFRSNLHFTPQLEDTLAVMLAVVISTTLKGDQLWLRVIGPPGSGKTTLAECISASTEYAYARSIITGFHSGMAGTGKNKKKDAGLIPRINGKTFIIKDADTLLSSPNKDRILGEMRDLYDGKSSNAYRNFQSRSYHNIQTTFILCGTDELRSLNRAFLGDRFLDCEILGSESTKPYLDRAVDNTYANVVGSMLALGKEEDEDNEAKDGDKFRHLKRATIGLIRHFKETLATIPPPSFPPKNAETLKALGQLLSYMRAKVRREGDVLAYRPRVELATRLVSQLVKLAVCLAIVRGKQSIDGEILRILRKVTLDTATGFTLEITGLLHANRQGLSASQIGHAISLSETSVKRNLADMLELGIARRVSKPNRSGIRGRHNHLWIITDTVRDLWSKSLGTGLITSKTKKGA